MKTVRTSYWVTTVVLLGVCVANAADTASIAVVPRPMSIERGEGRFRLTEKTSILVDRQSGEVADIARLLAERISRSTGFALAVSDAVGATDHRPIRLKLDDTASALGEEGYTLTVTPDGVTVVAARPAGLFYGMQTLLQLLPPAIWMTTKAENETAWTIPAVQIEDRPRFRWRSLMLDVSRHFFTKEEIKNCLDLMAQHKLNTFHWHLTDDPGWRIEIKRYPKLTEVGAWRTKDFWLGTEYPADKPYGGFYTRDDVREILAYAEARYITVLPEIEMPGHSVAALAAYPNLSCAGGAYNPNLGEGTPLGVYCAGNDDTFEFLENVLNEVLDMFPNRLIHIGGDEVAKDNWKKCSKCQARIQQEGLKDEAELQSYFICRIEKFLNAHDRIPVGWDEILEGGLAPNAIVMSWRGMDGGVAAAQLGHDVVMTPHTDCYFNNYQARNFSQARAREPLSFSPPYDSYLMLDQVYAFEPVPAEIPAEKLKHVLGAGGNLWTEFVRDWTHAQYMIFPRACAMAEVTWSDPKLKNWDDFKTRLSVHLQRLKAQGVDYRQPLPDDDAK